MIWAWVAAYVAGGCLYAFITAAFDMEREEDIILIQSFIWPLAVVLKILAFFLCGAVSLGEELRFWYWSNKKRR